MGSNLKEQFEGEIKDSEVKEYKEVRYKLFQHGDYKVRSSSSSNGGGFRCPLCNKENYNYTRLLRHAIQTAEGTSTSSGKQRARHSAMARYLAVDLAEDDDDDEQSLDSDSAPIVFKRFRSGTPVNALKSTAARTPASVDAQKLATAEKREKEVLKKAGELARKVNEMNALITASNKELLKVREELMKEKALNNTLNDGDNSSIGVKKIGELDVNVFKRACEKQFPVGEAEIRGVELCSKWREKLHSSLLWWRLEFQRLRDNEGNYKVVVNEKDVTLRGLKEEWGDEAYNAVVTALVDLHGYDKCESVKEYEIWNFKDNRKAKLEEVIGWLRSGKKELLESRYVVVSIK